MQFRHRPNFFLTVLPSVVVSNPKPRHPILYIPMSIFSYRYTHMHSIKKVGSPLWSMHRAICVTCTRYVFHQEVKNVAWWTVQLYERNHKSKLTSLFWSSSFFRVVFLFSSIFTSCGVSSANVFAHSHNRYSVKHVTMYLRESWSFHRTVKQFFQILAETVSNNLWF